MNLTRLRSAVLPLALGAALGCSSAGESGATPTTAPSASTPEPSSPMPMAVDRLPCEILDILVRRCASCHGTDPSAGGSVRLLSYADLLGFSRSDSAVQEGRLALQRFRDNALPMPPYPAEPLTQSELEAWTAWVSEGLQPRWRGAPDACADVAPTQERCDAVSQVFQVSCTTAQCHTALDPAAGLDLASPQLLERLSGARSTSADCAGWPLIDRAKPDDSLLLQKLRGAAGCGKPMPPPPLTLQAAQIDCVRSFISE